MNITMHQVRADLREIRYYYEMKEFFDSVSAKAMPISLLKKVSTYNEVMKFAPGRLFVVYAGLYLENHSQAGLAKEWNYSKEYIQELNQMLVEFLFDSLSKK